MSVSSSLLMAGYRCCNLRAAYKTATLTGTPLNSFNLRPQWHGFAGVDGGTWSSLKIWLDRVCLRRPPPRYPLPVSVRIHAIAARLNPANDLSVFPRGSPTTIVYQNSHLCHSPACVLPEHILVEPQGVNADRTNKGCKKKKKCSGHQGGVACIV